MNRAKAKRWLNEYLDGEIGLADKAEFERLMAQDPELRREFEQLRRIGLLMSSGPEVEVHPHGFRARLMERIEPQQRFNFTPQRAFAGSMLVALLVVTITFGQYIYSRAMQGRGGNGTTAVAGLQGSESSLNINSSASQFLNAALQRAESGESSSALRLVQQLDQQIGVFDGAVCSKGTSGYNYVFPGSLPSEFNFKADTSTLSEIEEISRSYPGSTAPLVTLSDGSQLNLRDFANRHPMGRVELRVSFVRP